MHLHVVPGRSVPPHKPENLTWISDHRNLNFTNKTSDFEIEMTLNHEWKSDLQ